MSAGVSFDSSGKASQGPAWGLKEQLKRFDTDGGKDVAGSTGGQQSRSAVATKSKIRVSVTGPGLADKIRQVKCKILNSNRCWLYLLLILYCALLMFVVGLLFVFTNPTTRSSHPPSVSVHTPSASYLPSKYNTLLIHREVQVLWPQVTRHRSYCKSDF